jgi:hypothetical protein
MDPEEGILGADEQELLEAEFSLKKKKKKTKKKTETADEGKPETEGDVAEKSGDGAKSDNNENDNVNVFDPPTYDYVQLLNRVVDTLHQNNPELADKKRFTMKPPQLMRGI